MTKLTAVASVALALAAGSAFAADLPYRKAPVFVPPPPTFTWTGLYGGVNIGYGFGNGGNETGSFIYPSPPAVGGSGGAWTLPTDLNGVLGGGQVGYNYQFNPWLVIGLETDIQAADVHYQNSSAGAPISPPGAAFHIPSINSAKSVDWFGTVRGRIGFVLPSIPTLMVYGTAGFAYGQVVHSLNIVDPYPTLVATAWMGGGQYDNTKAGWAAGGGVEWSPANFIPALSAFSIKVEYLYTDLGSTNLQGTSFLNMSLGAPTATYFAFNHTSETRFHTVRAGLNWHFNPFAAAPIVAKY